MNAVDENTQALRRQVSLMQQMIQGGAARLAVPRTRGSGPGMTPPDPRVALSALLDSRERVSALTEAARSIGVLPIRLYLLAAGWPVPPGNTVAEFVGACIRQGWKAIPAAVEPPKPGDLFVLTSPLRQPEAVGIVGKLDTAGEFFIGLLDGERARRGLREADFWLRVPG